MGQSYIIKRPRLTTLLDDSQARIILLCAPAGYGKTTLAREWIATRSEPVAWYRGGPEMLDVAAVAQSLAWVLKDIGFPDHGVARIAAIAARSSDANTLAHALAVGLGLATNTLLVIDDYQYASGEESEQLLARFIEETGVRALLTSRIRPGWITSRMSIYADALVVGRGDLSFTDEEVAAVLATSIPTPEPSLLSTAKGWPAVVGLAASRSEPLFSHGSRLMPDELYEYIANDMFRAASPEVQRSLFLLALGGDATPEVTRDLLGGAYNPHLSQAEALGFLTFPGDSHLDLHPLVRAFLMTKLHELDPPTRADYVRLSLMSLAKQSRWDECLNVLAEFTEDDLCVSLLREALPHLLATGRLASLKRWLGIAHARDDPVLLVAEAELALRAGDDAHAQVMAERASEISDESELTAQAHLVAARAAHLRGDGLAARRNAKRVPELSANSDRRVSATWLEFLTSFEEQDGAAQAILDQLRSVGRGSAEHALRLRWAQAFTFLEVDADVRAALREVELAHTFLPRVADPLVRTSFLNLGSSAALYAGQYDLALEFVALQLQEAELSGLWFAADHALATRAAALIGLRRAGDAQRVLDDLESRQPVSTFIQSQLRLKLARLRVAVGDIERAEVALRDPAPDALPRASYGEWFATHALYLAALGDTSRALLKVEEARAQSHYIDATSFTTLAAAIVELQMKKTPSVAATTAFAAIYRFGHIDALATAFRSYPRFAEATACEEALREHVTQVLVASRDIDIAKAAGLTVPREQRPRGTLSRRENEVLELIAAGRTYPQIASALFISESTTKVHVKHIFEKLGVRSRTEAALQYKKQRG